MGKPKYKTISFKRPLTKLPKLPDFLETLR